MSVKWVIGLIIGTMLLGYACGRRVGLKEGHKVGFTLAPIVLRQKSLENGYCVLCSETITMKEREKPSKCNNHGEVAPEKRGGQWGGGNPYQENG